MIYGRVALIGLGLIASSMAHAMRAGGFNGIDNEWWHFDMLDRRHVRQHFTRVD